MINEVFDGESVQRSVQQKVDNPVQYFFADQLSKVSSETVKQADLSFASPNVKYVALPVAKNEIVLRVENIGDQSAETINVLELVSKMYMQANGQKAQAIPENFKFTEMDITANMEISEMQARQIKWKTTEDQVEAKLLDFSTDMNQIKLESQRIRVFKVSLAQTEEAALFLN